MKDQRGTVHAYDYDALGRRTQDRITTVGGGVDGSVRRIETSYDVLGRVNRITSYDDATVGAGNVVNEVQNVYDNFGQLVTQYQSHTGSVFYVTTPNVQYAYAAATQATNQNRPTSMTYPDGRVLNYNYGSAAGMNDNLSRIEALIDNDGSTHLVDYTYLGDGTVIRADLAEPDVRLDLWGATQRREPFGLVGCCNLRFSSN